MKRGVWIVEVRRASATLWLLTGAYFLTKSAALRRADELNKINRPFWLYRATLYVPAAELTRKPRKRRKR